MGGRGRKIISIPAKTKNGYIVFTPERLATLLGVSEDELPTAVSEFIKAHKKEFETRKFPNRYIVTVPYQDLREGNPNHVEERDVYMMIVVFLKTKGILYSPKRKLTVRQDAFDFDLVFRLEDIYGN